jgi:hypothetical protein
VYDRIHCLSESPLQLKAFEEDPTLFLRFKDIRAERAAALAWLRAAAAVPCDGGNSAVSNAPAPSSSHTTEEAAGSLAEEASAASPVAPSAAVLEAAIMKVEGRILGWRDLLTLASAAGEEADQDHPGPRDYPELTAAGVEDAAARAWLGNVIAGLADGERLLKILHQVS